MTLAPKISTQDLGKEGELSALQYLKNRGFSIRERNYRFRGGEIDLIAEKGSALYFIEVKLRKSRQFGPASHAIPPSKRHKMARTAMRYVQGAKISQKELRFAALLVDDSEGKRLLEFLEFSLDLPAHYY